MFDVVESKSGGGEIWEVSSELLYPEAPSFPTRNRIWRNKIDGDRQPHHSRCL